MDASAGIEVALNRERSEVLNEYIGRSTKVITSDLYKAETTNALYKYVKAGLLQKADAIEMLHFCEMLIDEYIDMEENKEEALIESVRLNYSVYDLLYLTVARRYGAIVVTLDKKLNELAKECGIDTI